jgi:hypothetical protein
MPLHCNVCGTRVPAADSSAVPPAGLPPHQVDDQHGDSLENNVDAQVRSHLQGGAQQAPARGCSEESGWAASIATCVCVCVCPRVCVCGGGGTGVWLTQSA